MYHSNKPQLTDASTLTIGKTNWEEFKKKLDKQINCNMRFKSTEDIEKAMKKVTKIIQTTATLTPTTTKVAYKFNENSNVHNKSNKKKKKLKIEEMWRKYRTIILKRLLNKHNRKLIRKHNIINLKRI